MTLGEAIWLFAIFIVLAAVLYPVFFMARRHTQDYSCTSNEKQIGLGILQYAQDYDGLYPPQRAVGIKPTAYTFPGQTWENAVMPYVKSKAVFHCHEASGDEITPSYRYSDLTAGAKPNDFITPYHTIMLMDGDQTTDDVGHAWMPTSPPLPALFTIHGKCAIGFGATVEKAPLRHHGTANYLFADGHVKWLPPAAIFFPPRASASRSHKDSDGIAIGPDPAGAMTFAGTNYAATFHLR